MTVKRFLKKLASIVFVCGMMCLMICAFYSIVCAIYVHRTEIPTDVPIYISVLLSSVFTDLVLLITVITVVFSFLSFYLSQRRGVKFGLRRLDKKGGD